MAINTFEKTCDKIEFKYHPSNYLRENSKQGHMHDLSMFSDDNISSNDSKSSKIKKKSYKSPYLANNNVQKLPSRVKEKKVMHKRVTNVVSSFPLATNIYKANSDEFKSHIKGFKKVKKSVLTLPNEPACLPQTCTVSDMNDSEYLNSRGKSNKKIRTKKRFQAHKEKTKSRNKGYEFYDRDARFCSQMNIDLNCSSTDVIKFTGDCKRVSNKYHSSNKIPPEDDFKDVWAVLRNINKFQFRPSPTISDDDSIETPKSKKIINKRRSNVKQRRVIETCHRTKEFAYISSIDFKSPQSFSQSSSFDRITVIDKQEEVSEIFHELGNGVKRNYFKGKIRRQPNIKKNQNKCILKNNVKASRDNTLQMQRADENQIDQTKIDNMKKERSKKSSNDSQSTADSNREVSVIVSPKKEDFRHDEKEYDVQNDNTKTLCVYPVIRSQVEIVKEVDSIKREENKEDIESLMQSYGSEQNMKGITKVILSKGQNPNETKRNELPKRKPRLLTTIPTTDMMPRLTTGEIKRRLANMKFPIIVLGKDQLGGRPIQVTQYEHPQFQGLEKRMWPFVQDWYNENLPRKEGFTQKQVKPIEQVVDRKPVAKSKLTIQKEIKVNNRNLTNETFEKKQATLRPSNIEPLIKNKILKRPVPLYELEQNKASLKLKPAPHLPDTMIKLLYRKVSVKSLDEQSKASKSNDNKDLQTTTLESRTTKKIDASTETVTKLDQISVGILKTPSAKTSSEACKVPMITRPSWAKGKWASEFIENVIKKIRSGIYYNQENTNLNKTPPLNTKEVSIQTLLFGTDIVKEQDNFIKNKEINDIDFNINDKLLSYDNVTENKIILLPGFDNSPPALEIKTLNTKEISICHCTTNVMVQFDVTHFLDTEYRNRLPSSLIPVSMNENYSKIFKCKTTILNAALPAEICSIIPTVLKFLLDSTKQTSLPVIKPYKKNPNLYTISELLRNENPDIPKCPLPAIIGFSPEIQKLFKGIYTNKVTGTRPSKVKKPRLSLSNYNIANVLPMIKCIQQIFPLKVGPLDFKISKPKEIKIDRMNSTCTALQLYKPPEKYIITLETIKTSETFGKSSINSLLKQMWNHDLVIRFKISMPLTFTFENDNSSISIKLTPDANRSKEESSNIISTVKVNSLYRGFSKLVELDQPQQQDMIKASTLKMIGNKNVPMEQKVDKRDSLGYLSYTKKRGKSYVRLYKKCKSTSNLSGERSSSTSLAKIANLDDFIQALGCGKSMSSVFDGNIGNKILSSILEMKNWLTDISQRQAMLIVLLTNKKDTPNLVRFRPLLLQGIAVNRITRASELDMEIEVIERENFNSFPQFEGIPYKLETVENQDNLLEELFWIAKTTASDYQKPFDEFSEKLLKSLLEKRKKLNPSYLRVMARYVGLGLLKTPKKK